MEKRTTRKIVTKFEDWIDRALVGLCTMIVVFNTKIVSMFGAVDDASEWIQWRMRMW